MDQPGKITRLLKAWQAGDDLAYQQLFEITIDALRAIAANVKRDERVASYSTCSLVHEAFLHLRSSHSVAIQDSAHFFKLFSKIMRNRIIDQARRIRSEKRGGKLHVVELAEGYTIPVSPLDAEEFLDLDCALKKLEAVEPELARVVSLRYFGGLTIVELAEVMGVSSSTVNRKWETAKTYLYANMKKKQFDSF